MTGFAHDPLVGAITAETDRLLETIHGLDDEAVRQPSLCPGWTRAHVLTHLARNADGLRDVLAAATTGTAGAMYVSLARRNSDIEAGANRSAAELESDVETASDNLLAALAETPDEAMEVRVDRLLAPDDEADQSTIPAGKVPLMRIREVVLHHVDLDAGYTLAGAPPEFVVAELADSGRRFTAADPFVVDAGDAGQWRYGRDAEADADPIAGVVTVTGSPAELLAWITGRSDGAGLSTGADALPELSAWG